jgi:hypothetical protein
MYDLRLFIVLTWHALFLLFAHFLIVILSLFINSIFDRGIRAFNLHIGCSARDENIEVGKRIQLEFDRR